MADGSSVPGRSVSLTAHGKINLTLAVTGRRADGYHTLDGVMQSIGLGNRLTVGALPPGARRVELLCDDPALPTDRRNSAVRAAQALLEAAHSDLCLRIVLEKRVPYQAGLGSASADAAGALAGANALLGCPLSDRQLLAVAACVGADVPFCLTGGTRRAEGIGERLSPLPNLPDCALLIAKPPEGVSTPEAFARYDALTCPRQPDNGAIERALRGGELPAVAAACGNVLAQCCPVLTVAALREAMLGAGALGGAMSGSGSAVYGIFAGNADAARARRALSGKFSDCRFFVTSPARNGITFA